MTFVPFCVLLVLALVLVLVGCGGLDDPEALESTEKELLIYTKGKTLPSHLLVCGNGLINFGEECDGSTLAGQTCESLGFDGGQLKCDASCDFDISGCHFCGDGKVDPGESCDGSSFGFPSCTFYGYSSGSLACTSDCQVDTSGCSYGSGDLEKLYLMLAIP